MSAQSAMQGLASTIIDSAKKLGAGNDKTSAGPSDSGIDMQMATKARKEVQSKINAAHANKEISNRAKSRKMGKVIDGNDKDIGGKS